MAIMAIRTNRPFHRQGQGFAYNDIHGCNGKDIPPPCRRQTCILQ